MAGTYTKIYIQIVFSVYRRQPLILNTFRNELFSYMAGIIKDLGHKTIIINGTADHVHIFIGLKPETAIADLVRMVKNNSSKFVNDRGWLKRRFAWQSGYGAFSYSYDKVNLIYDYIHNQDIHHQKMEYKDEYRGMLESFEIEYDNRYLLDP